MSASNTALAASITYTADAKGRRTSRYEPSAATPYIEYLYDDDGVQPIAEYRNVGGDRGLDRWYVYGSRANVPDYVVVGTEKYRIISDYLGSPRLVVKQDGTIMERSAYDAWGNRTSSYVVGSWWRPIPFGFAGGLEDRTTGLLRFGAREYDPRTGRWLARDPAGLAGGTNLYSYAGNDPVNYIDVDGRSPVLVVVLLSGAANGLANWGWQHIVHKDGMPFDARAPIVAAGWGMIQASILVLSPGSSVIFNIGLGAALGAAQSVANDLWPNNECAVAALTLRDIGRRAAFSAVWGGAGGYLGGGFKANAGIYYDPVKFPKLYIQELYRWNAGRGSLGAMARGGFASNAQGWD